MLSLNTFQSATRDGSSRWTPVQEYVPMVLYRPVLMSTSSFRVTGALQNCGKPGRDEASATRNIVREVARVSPSRLLVFVLIGRADSWLPGADHVLGLVGWGESHQGECEGREGGGEEDHGEYARCGEGPRAVKGPCSSTSRQDLGSRAALCTTRGPRSPTGVLLALSPAPCYRGTR